MLGIGRPEQQARDLAVNDANGGFLGIHRKQPPPLYPGEQDVHAELRKKIFANSCAWLGRG